MKLNQLFESVLMETRKSRVMTNDEYYNARDLGLEFLEKKGGNVSREEILNYLYKHTNLCKNFLEEVYDDQISHKIRKA